MNFTPTTPLVDNVTAFNAAEWDKLNDGIVEAGTIAEARETVAGAQAKADAAQAAAIAAAATDATTKADAAEADAIAAFGTTYQALSAKGAANGYASLDGSGVVPSSQISQLRTTNNQTGTTYTLALTDVGKVVERNNAAANTTTVPANATVAFPIGSEVRVWNQGAGVSTVDAAAGVTLTVAAGASLALAQGQSLTLRKRATDEWAVDVSVAGGGGAVTSVSGRTGAVVLTSADVGLGNVDNTSDLAKPVSTATQSALNLKATTTSLATVATTGQFDDLIGAPVVTDASSFTTGLLSIEREATGSVFVVDYYKSGGINGAANAWPATRPSARTDIRFIWSGPTSPGVIAIAGDKIEIDA